MNNTFEENISKFWQETTPISALALLKLPAGGLLASLLEAAGGGADRRNEGCQQVPWLALFKAFFCSQKEMKMPNLTSF